MAKTSTSKKGQGKTPFRKSVNIRNKRATYDYEVLERLTAGIVLTGNEIKSIRMGRASLGQSFCYVDRGEVWVKNMYIGTYAFGSWTQEGSRRDRTLLLNKREIRHLTEAQHDPGFTIVPLRLFINGKGLAKLEIAIAKGKKEYDKRNAIRDREMKRELDRARRTPY